MTEQLAYIALNGVTDIGPVRVKALLDVFGTAERVLAASPEALARVHGIGAKVARAIHEREPDFAEKECELAARAGVDIITLADAAYPALLKEIHDPPLCLYVRGDPGVLCRSRSSIAMVGSRQTTRYGMKMADHLSRSAALAGWVVYSGLARGIDTIVHKGALDAGGETVAVVGSGLAHMYPQENMDLARRIVDSGALISEFPMRFPPSKRTFPMRNRIISGLTLGTIVVEAGFHSGSIITANQALDQNRLVFAVPGPADSPQSRGCHGLIKGGMAKLVENFQDVLEEFSFLPGLTSEKRDILPGGGLEKAAPGDLTLSPHEVKLLSLIGEEDIGVDTLVNESGLSAPEVLSALLMLEMKRHVRQLPGRRVVKS
ncbi:MAG: DNA-processing protein DprA [Lentisphaeria bacterium]|nr:DNA-processing protein DprA [Lentisphaeria bacterium]